MELDGHSVLQAPRYVVTTEREWKVLGSGILALANGITYADQPCDMSIICVDRGK